MTERKSYFNSCQRRSWHNLLTCTLRFWKLWFATEPFWQFNYKCFIITAAPTSVNPERTHKMIATCNLDESNLSPFKYSRHRRFSTKRSKVYGRLFGTHHLNFKHILIMLIKNDDKNGRHDNFSFLLNLLKMNRKSKKIKRSMAWEEFLISKV